MEEWEDELQDELNSICEDFIEKGLTTRQIIGCLSTVKFEYTANMSVIELEEE